MTFKDWKEGKPFEMQAPGAGTRYGVKILLLEYYEDDPDEPGERRRRKANAFFFDTNTLEFVAHNKKLEEVRPLRGRLARTHDNAFIVVKPLRKGVWAGYYVNLTRYQTFSDSEIDLIPVEVGERRDEVDITLKKLRKALTKADIYLKELELDLIE